MVLGAAMMSGPVRSQALPPGLAVTWRCWYAAGESPWLACEFLETETSIEIDDADPAPDIATPPAANPGPRLPAIVRIIRERPAFFRDKRVFIPLYTHPIEMARAERLARAVLCGARPGCTVILGGPPGSAGRVLQ